MAIMYQINFLVHNYATILPAILIVLHLLLLLSKAPGVHEMFLLFVDLSNRSGPVHPLGVRNTINGHRKMRMIFSIACKLLYIFYFCICFI